MINLHSGQVLVSSLKSVEHLQTVLVWWEEANANGLRLWLHTTCFIYAVSLSTPITTLKILRWVSQITLNVSILAVPIYYQMKNIQNYLCQQPEHSVKI